MFRRYEQLKFIIIDAVVVGRRIAEIAACEDRNFTIELVSAAGMTALGGNIRVS